MKSPVRFVEREKNEKDKKTIETCSHTNDIRAHKIITLNAPMEKEEKKMMAKNPRIIYNIVCDMQ